MRGRPSGIELSPSAPLRPGSRFCAESPQTDGWRHRSGVEHLDPVSAASSTTYTSPVFESTAIPSPCLSDSLPRSPGPARPRRRTPLSRRRRPHTHPRWQLRPAACPRRSPDRPRPRSCSGGSSSTDRRGFFAFDCSPTTTGRSSSPFCGFARLPAFTFDTPGIRLPHRTVHEPHRTLRPRVHAKPGFGHSKPASTSRAFQAHQLACPQTLRSLPFFFFAAVKPHRPARIDREPVERPFFFHPQSTERACPSAGNRCTSGLRELDASRPHTRRQPHLSSYRPPPARVPSAPPSRCRPAPRDIWLRTPRIPPSPSATPQPQRHVANPPVAVELVDAMIAASPPHTHLPMASPTATPARSPSWPMRQARTAPRLPPPSQTRTKHMPALGQRPTQHRRHTSNETMQATTQTASAPTRNGPAPRRARCAPRASAVHLSDEADVSQT